MVQLDVDESQGLGVIVMQRNKSLSWRGNKIFFYCMVSVSLTIAIFFTLLGAWPILPFAGLELSVLGVCLYLSALEAKNKEVLLLQEEFIEFSRGRSKRLHQQQLARPEVYFSYEPPETPSQAARLLMSTDDETVELGLLLTDDEKEELSQQLTKFQLNWHNRHIFMPVVNQAGRSES